MTTNTTEDTLEAQPATAMATHTDAATPARAPRYTEHELAETEIRHDTELPSLDNHVSLPIPLQVEYWSPENPGEEKRGWILGVEEQLIADRDTGELRRMESILFVEETKDGKKARIQCAAKLLVASVQDAIRRGEIVPGNLRYPVKITYTGIKKCKNGNKANKWEITPLVVRG